MGARNLVFFDVLGRPRHENLLFYVLLGAPRREDHVFYVLLGTPRRENHVLYVLLGASRGENLVFYVVLVVPGAENVVFYEVFLFRDAKMWLEKPKCGWKKNTLEPCKTQISRPNLVFYDVFGRAAGRGSWERGRGEVNLSLGRG